MAKRVDMQLGLRPRDAMLSTGQWSALRVTGEEVLVTEMQSTSPDKQQARARGGERGGQLEEEGAPRMTGVDSCLGGAADQCPVKETPSRAGEFLLTGALGLPGTGHSLPYDL